MSAPWKDLESVCVIGTQCRCVGSGCHLEKAEWAGGGGGTDAGGTLPLGWFDGKIKETMEV